MEVAGREHVAGAVDRDAVAVVGARAAEALRPEVRAVGAGELLDEDVLEAGAHERPAAEVDRPLEEAGHGHVAARVDRHGVAVVDVRAPEALRP